MKVYVVMWGRDSYDHAKTTWAVFTSKEKLLETVNAQSGMKAWINEQGEPEIKADIYWYDVTEITLDKWD